MEQHDQCDSHHHEAEHGDSVRNRQGSIEDHFIGVELDTIHEVVVSV
jgi:hypothetical protein